MPADRPSFALRAVTAVGLMAGFYLLALGLAGGLLWLIYADVAIARRVHLKLIVLAGAGALAILKGCFFLADRFEAPGPEVAERDQPRLFAAIREVAAAMGARMPQAVYLIPDVNAFVADVGGFMGIVGARRVMGIGVGLLSVDSLSQLKATVAHEFGHFHGGDTQLGGFLYRTRASIGRVIAALGGSAILSKPFEWYGKLFLWLTHAIARGQELAADAFSVRVAGKAAHVGGLKREGVGGVLFGEFFRQEVSPLVDEGYAPANAFEGFRRFLGNLGEDGVLRRVEEHLHGLKTDPYDTHPALSERIAYAEALPDPGVPDDPRPAHELLEDREGVERALTRTILKSAAEGGELKPLGWEQVAGTVYAARMARAAKAFEGALGGAVSDLDALVRRLGEHDRVALARGLAPGAFEAPADDAAELAQRIVAHHLLARIGDELVRTRGFRWDTAPGRPLVLVGTDGRPVDLGSTVDAASKGPEGVAALVDRLRALGLAAAAPGG